MNQIRGTTKNRMIAAMVELIERQGYHATGLNQLTQVSGTPKGSLYFHFPGGKEELAAESIRVAGAEIGERLAATLNSDESLGDAISAFVLRLAQELQTSNFRKACPIAMVAMETAGTSEPLRQACKQVYAAWFALVEQRLTTAGIEPGAAAAWTTLIWSAIEGALLLSRTDQSTHPLETIAVQFQHLLNQELSHDLYP